MVIDAGVWAAGSPRSVERAQRPDVAEGSQPDITFQFKAKINNQRTNPPARPHKFTLNWSSTEEDRLPPVVAQKPTVEAPPTPSAHARRHALLTFQQVGFISGFLCSSDGV